MVVSRVTKVHAAMVGWLFWLKAGIVQRDLGRAAERLRVLSSLAQRYVLLAKMERRADQLRHIRKQAERRVWL